MRLCYVFQIVPKPSGQNQPGVTMQLLYSKIVTTVTIIYYKQHNIINSQLSRERVTTSLIHNAKTEESTHVCASFTLLSAAPASTARGRIIFI